MIEPLGPLDLTSPSDDLIIGKLNEVIEAVTELDECLSPIHRDFFMHGAEIRDLQDEVSKLRKTLAQEPTLHFDYLGDSSPPILQETRQQEKELSKGENSLEAKAQQLLDAAHEYWKASSRVAPGAVRWLTGEDGSLVIFTRGEYREELLRNIPNPSSPPHRFASAQREYRKGE